MEAHPDFWDSPEARIAFDECGTDSAGFWSTIGKLADRTGPLRAELEKHGLTLDEVAELRSKAVAALGDLDDDNWTATSDVVRAVRAMFVHALRPEQIAAVLGLDIEAVSGYVKQWGDSDHHLDILALHEQGQTPVQIARIVGTSRTTVYRTLEVAGKTPHRTNRRRVA